MPQVMTTNAIVTCPHGGLGTSIPTSSKWLVNGGLVLRENDTGTLGCTFALYPCIGYTLKSMNLNSTQVDGRNVILTTDFNQTYSGLPLMITEIHQVIDNSSPVPIPAGENAPPLSLELADTTPPSVTCTPPLIAFNSAAPTPALATFNLSSDFPMQWILTLINTSNATNEYVANGKPPGLVVTPTGGQWNSSTLIVTLSMTPLFMADLGIGSHYFFMTGVNQRGLTGFAELQLLVT